MDGLEGRARAEREELIEWLLDRGFDINQIRGSFSPMLLPTNRVLGEDEALVSAREVSETSGVPLELLQRLHRAVGLARADDPDSPLLSRADAESVLHAAALADFGLEPEEVVLITRLLMEGCSHAAVAMRRGALQILLRPGASELELAQAAEAMARESDPLIGPMVEDLLRLALRHSFATEAIDATERAAGRLSGARDITVAFADLVGFTRLGEELPPEELGQMAGRLVDLALDVVADPVQFVKAIGDAVMLVSPDPRALLKTVFDLVDAAADDNFPRLRVGVALGPAISRGGDWYGSPVNVASRVTGTARPGTVLVTESARHAIGEPPGVAWSAGRPRRLKGLREPVRLFRISRATTD